MRRITAIISMLLAISAFTACSSELTGNESQSPQTTSTSKVTTVSTMPTIITFTFTDADKDDEYDSTINNVVEQASPSDDTKAQENVLYNDNNILVISKELLDTRTGGKELEIYIENNNTSDYYVHAENVSINGYQVITAGTWLSVSGKKLNDSIEMYSSELSKNNITDIDKIEFTLRFSSSETDEEFYSDVIVLEY